MATAPCRSCGAAMAPGAARCDLCGTPAGALDPTDVMAGPPADGASPDGALADGATCTACGHANPAGARFCNACGAALAAPARPPVDAEASSERPSSEVGRQALVLVGVGLALVVAVFAFSTFNARTAPPPTAEAPAVGPADPIPDGPAPALPDSAQAIADALEADDSAASWYEAGRYYLTAAFQSTQTNPVMSAQWARRAIANFERSLALEPNPDVRLALAEAATFDPSNPMRPVQELQALLTEVPDHPGGNFLLGERRLLIGRVDSAEVSFRRAIAGADPGDPVIARAQQGLAAVAAQRERSP